MKLVIRKISFFLWLLSIFVFIGIFVYLILADKTLNQLSGLFNIFLTGSVPTGFLSFIVYVATFANSGNKLYKESKKIKSEISEKISKTSNKTLANPWFIFCVLLLLILTYVNSRPDNLFLNLKNILTPPVTPTLETIPTVETAPTKIIINKPIPTSDPDPIINCKSDNFGILKIRKSECNRGRECQVGDKWMFAASEADCLSAQNAISGQSASVSIPVYTNNNQINAVTCTVSYPCSGNTYTYKLLPDDCKDAQQKAIDMCKSFESSGSLPTTQPLPTIDTSAAKQRCYDNVLSDYNNAKSNCSYVARGYGAGSSSWLDLCLKTAENDFVYAQSLCK